MFTAGLAQREDCGRLCTRVSALRTERAVGPAGRQLAVVPRLVLAGREHAPRTRRWRAKTRKPAGAGSRRPCPLRPHLVIRPRRTPGPPGYGIGLGRRRADAYS